MDINTELNKFKNYIEKLEGIQDDLKEKLRKSKINEKELEIKISNLKVKAERSFHNGVSRGCLEGGKLWRKGYLSNIDTQIKNLDGLLKPHKGHKDCQKCNEFRFAIRILKELKQESEK